MSSEEPSRVVDRFRGTCFEIRRTPPEEKRRQKNEALARQIESTQTPSLLELVPFGNVPHIPFDNVRLGSCTVRKVVVRNPTKKPVRVMMEKLPKAEKGFQVDYTDFTLESQEEAILSIGWVPQNATPLRESVVVRFGSTFKTQMLLVGTCKAPPQSNQNKSRVSSTFRRPPLRPASVQNRSSLSTVKGKAQAEAKKVTLPDNPVVRQEAGMQPPVRNYVDETKENLAQQKTRGFPAHLQVESHDSASWSPQPPREVDRKETFVAEQVSSPRRETFLIPSAANEKQQPLGDSLRRETFIASNSSLFLPVTSTPVVGKASSEQNYFSTPNEVPKQMEEEEQRRQTYLLPSTVKKPKGDQHQKENMCPPQVEEEEEEEEESEEDLTAKKLSDIKEEESETGKGINLSLGLSGLDLQLSPPKSKEEGGKKRKRSSRKLSLHDSVVEEKVKETTEEVVKKTEVDLSDSEEPKKAFNFSIGLSNVDLNLSSPVKDDEQQHVSTDTYVKSPGMASLHDVEENKEEVQMVPSIKVDLFESGENEKVDQGNTSTDTYIQSPVMKSKDIKSSNMKEEQDIDVKSPSMKEEYIEEVPNVMEEDDEDIQNISSDTYVKSPRLEKEEEVEEMQNISSDTYVKSPGLEKEEETEKQNVEPARLEKEMQNISSLGLEKEEEVEMQNISSDTYVKSPCLEREEEAEMQNISSDTYVKSPGLEKELTQRQEEDMENVSSGTYVKSPGLTKGEEENVSSTKKESNSALHISTETYVESPSVANLDGFVAHEDLPKVDHTLGNISGIAVIANQSVSQPPMPVTHPIKLSLSGGKTNKDKEVLETEAIQMTFGDRLSEITEEPPLEKEMQVKPVNEPVKMAKHTSTPKVVTTNTKSNVFYTVPYDTTFEVSKIAEKKKVLPIHVKKNLRRSVGANVPPANVLKSKQRGRVSMAAPGTRLTLIKPMRTSRVVHHPNPFAARNMYYDERWIEKQESGFKKWLNFVLTPPEGFDDASTAPGKLDVAKLWMACSKDVRVPRAPTREVLSMRAYTARRELNRLRRDACTLWQSPGIARVITKTETEVEMQRIAVRTDKDLHRDVGMKKRLLILLLNYNPLWLRVGLETVFGEIIPMHNGAAIDLMSLSQFIVARFLSNPDILAMFAHPTVPHHYRPGYEVALKRFTLKKFLQLVYFLDQAKTFKLIKHNPCLFARDSPVKMSRHLLTAFSRDFLSGEGDVIKHLAYLGYKVVHKQSALDEFDFAVTNVATDLKCGVRLCRVLEILTNQGLTDKLRLPAVSRLQKVHNVDLALAALKASEAGLPPNDNTSSRDIVDGHMEKTLNLLWHIIFGFQLGQILDVDRLSNEVAFLEKTLRYRVRVGDVNAKRGQNFVMECKRGAIQEESKKDVSDWANTTKMQLLLEWARLVCAHYGLEIENLSVSFSDGRAMCFILHHYYPAFLPTSDIAMHTTQHQMNKDNLDSSLNDSFGTTMTYSYGKGYEQLLSNEKQNYKLLHTKIQELGGIPMIIKSSEMSNTIPDQKVTATFLTYLAARLLDLSAEMKAARTIQLAWKRYIATKREQELKVKYAS